MEGGCWWLLLRRVEVIGHGVIDRGGGWLWRCVWRVDLGGGVGKGLGL